MQGMWENCHIAKACQATNKKQSAANNKRAKKGTVSLLTEPANESEPKDLPLLAIQSLRNKSNSRIKIQLEIQGVEMIMKLDTGASVSIILDRVYKEKFPNVVLKTLTLC